MTAAGELNAAVGEEGVKRYIAMTCQTDDPEREAAYLALRSRDRAQAQADAERDPQPLSRHARPVPSCRTPAIAVFDRASKIAVPCFERQTFPAKRSWPSSSSSTRRSSGR